MLKQEIKNLFPLVAEQVQELEKVLDVTIEDQMIKVNDNFTTTGVVMSNNEFEVFITQSLVVDRYTKVQVDIEEGVVSYAVN
ncbi:MAG TPA: hypothetical protein VLA13_08210 [Massilibacterium sp.]|nr:hypothetical protein [Massilibacterium sp.]